MSKKWEKVLYKKQNVSDNYVDPSFLSDLRKNVNIRHYTFLECFTGVCAVTHEISCTVLFVVVFVYIEQKTFSILIILSSMISLLALCGILASDGVPKVSGFTMSDVARHLKSIILFLSLAYIFSPVLKTLTQSISTDTIYAMTTLMMMGHVLFQDYGAESAFVSKTLSLNSALFGAVCLASRLTSTLDIFVLVILAILIFVLLPLIRRKLIVKKSRIFITTTVFFTITLYTLFTISSLFGTLFACLCFSINVFFPALFVRFQGYKDNIYGPWDEAVVKQD